MCPPWPRSCQSAQSRECGVTEAGQKFGRSPGALSSLYQPQTPACPPVISQATRQATAKSPLTAGRSSASCLTCATAGLPYTPRAIAGKHDAITHPLVEDFKQLVIDNSDVADDTPASTPPKVAAGREQRLEWRRRRRARGMDGHALRSDGWLHCVIEEVHIVCWVALWAITAWPIRQALATPRNDPRQWRG